MKLLFWRREKYVPPYESPEEAAAWANEAKARRIPVELLKDAGRLLPIYDPVSGIVVGYTYRTVMEEYLEFTVQGMR